VFRNHILSFAAGFSALLALCAWGQPVHAAELELKGPPGCPAKPYGDWHYYFSHVSYDRSWTMTTETIDIEGGLPEPTKYAVHKTENGASYLKLIPPPGPPRLRQSGYTYIDTGNPYIYIAYYAEEEARKFLQYRLDVMPPCLVRQFVCDNVSAVENAIQQMRDIENEEKRSYPGCMSSEYIHKQFVDAYRNSLE